MYNYYGFNSSENYSLNSNLRWQLRSGWAISTDFYYGINQRRIFRNYDPALSPELQGRFQSGHNTYRFGNKQMSIGIEKSFGRSIMDNSASLEMLYFDDTNSNGVRDLGEHAIPGILVELEGLVAVTSATERLGLTEQKAENMRWLL